MKEKHIRFRTTDGVFLRGVLTTPDKDSEGAVVLAHGFTGEKHEDGFFSRIAGLLAKNQLTVLRFDFRGHGHSAGRSRDVTIKGEIHDLSTAVNLLKSRGHKKLLLWGTVSVPEFPYF